MEVRGSVCYISKMVTWACANPNAYSRHHNLSKKTFSMNLRQSLLTYLAIFGALVIVISNAANAAEVRGELEVGSQLAGLEQWISCGGNTVNGPKPARRGSYSMTYDGSVHRDCSMCFAGGEHKECVGINAGDALQVLNFKIIGNQNGFYLIIK